MALKILTNNIVVLFEANITSTSLENLQTSIVSIYRDKNPQPVTAKFPDLAALNIPEAQLSLLLQGRTAVITDQNIAPYSSKENEKLLRVAIEVVHEIKTPIEAYGFNYIFEFENGTFDNLSQKIKTNFFAQDSGLTLPASSNLKYILPFVVYDYEGKKVSIKVEPVVENNIEQARMRISTNTHFATSSLPELPQLLSSYNEIDTHLEEYIGRIFS
ncbi:MAG: hypothetical protein WC289_04080 [Patescibacteria group bacterium]|jgi:hypothetical protein